MNRKDENGFEETTEWLRSARPPFSEEDHAAIRRAVWREIEARRRPDGAFRPGMLVFAGGAVLAAALVAALWLRPLTAPSVPVQAPRAEWTPTDPKVPAALAVASSAEMPRAPARPAPAAPRRLLDPTVSRAARTTVGEGVPVKIEFQTANPNVRIIWLVKKGEAMPHPGPTGRKEETS